MLCELNCVKCRGCIYCIPSFLKTTFRWSTGKNNPDFRPAVDCVSLQQHLLLIFFQLLESVLITIYQTLMTSKMEMRICESNEHILRSSKNSALGIEISQQVWGPFGLLVNIFLGPAKIFIAIVPRACLILTFLLKDVFHVYACYPAKLLFNKSPTSHSEGVVPVVNCRHHGDYMLIHCVITLLLADVSSDYTFTVQSLCLVGDWWNRSSAIFLEQNCRQVNKFD